jgi:hypothetical protein
MATSTTQIPRLFKNPRGWLTLIVIYVVAGAILGSPGRGPVSEEDTSWQKWAAIVAPWLVYGGLIGAMTHWHTGQFGSYRRAIVSFAILLPVLLVKLSAFWHGFFGAIWHDALGPCIVNDPCGQACPQTVVARGKDRHWGTGRAMHARTFHGPDWIRRSRVRDPGPGRP